LGRLALGSFFTMLARISAEAMPRVLGRRLELYDLPSMARLALDDVVGRLRQSDVQPDQ
jgi:hypothetical protein